MLRDGWSADALRGSCLRSRPAQTCPPPPPVSGGSALPGALSPMPVRSELTAYVLPQHAQTTARTAGSAHLHNHCVSVRPIRFQPQPDYPTTLPPSSKM
eukprot:scaffold54945_cov33-Phaeocystis_antarctica.AAC.1